MDFAFNLYALSLILFGSISFLLSIYVLNNEKGAVRCMGLVILSNAIWSVAYGFELASLTLEQMKILIDIEYIGIASVPFNWFLFCLVLAGKEKLLKKTGNILLLVFVPAVTLLVVWTNDYHHLHYISLKLDESGNFPTLKIARGISYYIFTLYFYILLFVGNYFLIRKFRKSDAVYKRQNRVILFAALIPWIANIIYIIGFKPFGNMDPTPYAFLISSIMIFIAIYRFKLFDILPVAREKVLDLMQDGFIVLDHDYRIIDYNLAFTKYTRGLASNKIIGKNIVDIFKDQHELINLLTIQESGKIEMLVTSDNGSFDLEADIRFLNENNLSHAIIIVKFQDLTNLRQEALKSQHQADELQKLNQLKDRIFSIMAHDLRGPLLNLSEVLKMTADDTISTEEFKQLSPTLAKDIMYTTDLLENILHWSRSQLKGYSINKEAFDLEKLILSEIHYHSKAAGNKQISITQTIPAELTAYADLLMMQIVIRNLIANAIKFCHAKCQIDISAVNLNKDYIGVCIKDNGVGISPENIQRIFNGENVSSRGTQNEKGTGIGLMVCWEFMARNEGSITIQSVVGAGTVFNLGIPRHSI